MAQFSSSLAPLIRVIKLNSFMKPFSPINCSIPLGQYSFYVSSTPWLWLDFRRRSAEYSLVTVSLTQRLVRLIQLFETSSHRQPEHNSQIIETSSIFFLKVGAKTHVCQPRLHFWRTLWGMKDASSNRQLCVLTKCSAIWLIKAEVRQPRWSLAPYSTPLMSTAGLSPDQRFLALNHRGTNQFKTWGISIF